MKKGEKYFSIKRPFRDIYGFGVYFTTGNNVIVISFWVWTIIIGKHIPLKNYECS